MIDWSVINVDLSRYRDRHTGNVKVVCPFCNDTRKNKGDKSLSCNLETGAYFCHHCLENGYATTYTEEERQEWMRQQPWYREYTKKKAQPKKEYAKPDKIKSDTELDPKTVQWFATRGISEATLKLARVTTGMEWMPPHGERRQPKGAQCQCIHFNYYRDGELVNVKLRSGDKSFRQVAGCEQIAYNLDGIKWKDDCYIVEGEMDALTLMEIGYTNVVSVPDGGGQKAMNWLIDYYEEYFADKKTIYICSDLDEVGMGLRDELCKHFDPGSYVIVDDYGTDPKTGHRCKDVNECLMALGRDELRKRLASGHTVRPEGDADMERIGQDLDQLYLHGLPQGLKIGFPALDELLRLEKGRLIMVTGTPGSGKSQFLDMVSVMMNVNHGWRFSMFSPEMMPLSLHMSMLVSKFTGKPFSKEAIGPQLYQQAKERVQDAVHFIDTEDYDLDDILSVAKYQIRKYGCDALVIDPWNDLTSKGEGLGKTDDINIALLKILTFAQRQKVVAFVMAHPSKMGRNKDGTPQDVTLYDISGSAHFYNRADSGVVLKRHTEEGKDYVEVIVMKNRFPNLGQTGSCYFKYQKGTGRLHPYDPVTDVVDWMETSYITGETPQTSMDRAFEAATSGPSEANVQGFLQQAARADRADQARRNAMPEDENPFKEDTETPF